MMKYYIVIIEISFDSLTNFSMSTNHISSSGSHSDLFICIDLLGTNIKASCNIKLGIFLFIVVTPHLYGFPIENGLNRKRRNTFLWQAWAKTLQFHWSAEFCFVDIFFTSVNQISCLSGYYNCLFTLSHV